MIKTFHPADLRKQDYFSLTLAWWIEDFKPMQKRDVTYTNLKWNLIEKYFFFTSYLCSKLS